MAILLKTKGGTKIIKALPAPVSEAPHTPDASGYASPFKTSAHDASVPDAMMSPNVEAAIGPEQIAPGPRKDVPLQVTAPSKKPVVRLSGGKPLKPANLKQHTHSEVADLAEAGLLPETVNPNKLLYPEVYIGQRVKITNSMFPHVMHYKPGDVCKVVSKPQHLNTAYDDPIKFGVHILEVIEEADPKGRPTRVGNRVMMFRYEFMIFDPDAKVRTKVHVNTIKG